MSLTLSEKTPPRKSKLAGVWSELTFIRFDPWFSAVVLGAMIVVFLVAFGRLALLRYQNHEAGGMDLGYISQIFYNTAHQEPFRLTVYDPNTAPDRYSNYFFYHAEPIIFVLAPFYGLFNRPEALLIFQVVALSSGAIPAYWLARDSLGRRWAGLAFAAIYLLAPALQSASLSDYHNVALAAPLFMYAFYFGWKKKALPFIIFTLLAAATKEDATLLAVFFGLYAFFVWRLRWAGGLVAGLALAWLMVLLGVIMPHFADRAGQPPIFLYRYRAYGSNLVQVITTILFNPLYVWKTLPRGEIIAYIGGLWQQSGVWLIFNPLAVLIGLPVLAINIFSDNGWQYSGGAHYSTALVPFLLGGSMTGLAWLSSRLKAAGEKPKENIANILSPSSFRSIGVAVALVIAIFYYARTGVGPLAFNAYNPQPDPAQVAHQQLLSRFVTQIPAEASVSAQSGLVAYVSQRRTVFMYPRLSNNEEMAQYILLDVTSNPFPQKPPVYQQGVQALLRSGDYSLVEAEDGYILLEHRLPNSIALPQKFYSFSQSAAGRQDYAQLRHDLTVQTPNASLMAGGELRLLGVEVMRLNTIGDLNPTLEITTYWEVLRSPSRNWQILYEFSDDRNLSGEQGRATKELFQRVTPAISWQPSTSWQPGQVRRVRDYPVFAGKYRNITIKLEEPKPELDER